MTVRDLSVNASYFMSNWLTVVRSAISIVPQSPDLFEGTLRENIDPVGLYADVDIWIALSQVCGIIDVVTHAYLFEGTSERICRESTRRLGCSST
jgi:ABC-type transport system involved in cytochrome bd biosynthesis fused ATPase/permease subunit